MNGFGFRALSMSPSAALNREIDVYRTCQTRKSRKVICKQTKSTTDK